MKDNQPKNLRVQKLFIIALLLMVVIIGGYQVYDFIEKSKQADDITYTAAVFKTPMKQSIEVLMISASEQKDSIIDNKNNKIQYSDIKNYKEENLQRYISYHKENPELLDAEVIWRVNTDLDYAYYTNVKIVENPQKLTTIVNKYNRLASDFEPDDLVLMESEAGEYYLREEAYNAFLEMKEAISKYDLTINVISAYRRYQYQQELYDNYVSEYGQEEADTFSARPGHSGHQLGLVVDVNDGKLVYTDFGKTEAYDWIKENAHRYGFIVRYKGNPELTGYQVEPWHLRYVGKDIAVDMYESNIAILEEYLDKKAALYIEE